MKDLIGSSFGSTPEQIRIGALVFANAKVTNYFGDNDKMCVGKDWSSGFLKINGDIALKKPEGLWRTSAQGLNNKAVDFFFHLYRNLRTELNIRNKPHLVFNMDETWFSFNNIPPKIVTTKGVRIL